MRNLANIITLGRICIIPFILYFMVQSSPLANLWAAGLFILASFSDFLDGILARQRKWATPLGYFLDPLADKILALSILLMYLVLPQSPFWVVIPVALILSREISVGALFSIAQTEKVQLKTNRSEKVKNTLQFITLVCLLIHKPYGPISFQEVGLILLVLSTFFSLISALGYSRQFYLLFKQKEGHGIG